MRPWPPDVLEGATVRFQRFHGEHHRPFLFASRATAAPPDFQFYAALPFSQSIECPGTPPVAFLTWPRMERGSDGLDVPCLLQLVENERDAERPATTDDFPRHLAGICKYVFVPFQGHKTLWAQRKLVGRLTQSVFDEERESRENAKNQGEGTRHWVCMRSSRDYCS